MGGGALAQCHSQGMDHVVEEDGPAVGGNNHALGSCQWPSGSGVPVHEACWRSNAGAVCHALS